MDLFGVVADPTVTRGAAARHFAESKAGFRVLFDASGLLGGVLRPTHIPEAFVLGRDGRLAYRGAIDNVWEAVGKRQPQAEREYLADAIAAALDGRPAAVAETKPVGCPVEPAGDRPTT